MLTPHHLTCEYFTNPLGLDVLQPRMSWKSSSIQRGARQTAYHLIVADSPASLDASALGQETKGVLWDTGKVHSSVSQQISYAGTRGAWRLGITIPRHRHVHAKSIFQNDRWTAFTITFEVEIASANIELVADDGQWNRQLMVFSRWRRQRGRCRRRTTGN